MREAIRSDMDNTKSHRALIVDLVKNTLGPCLAHPPNEEETDGILEGYDFFSDHRQKKLIRSVDHRRYKKCYDLDLYLNGICWRITELVRALASLWATDNQLSVAIVARHIYETLAHLFYFLRKLDGYLEAGEGKEFFQLIWSFGFGTNWDYQLNPEDVRREYADKTLHVEKVHHINKSLEYFRKKRIKERAPSSRMIHGKSVFLPDKQYLWASQVAHPNSLGSIQFFCDGGNEGANRVLFNHSQEEPKRHNVTFSLLCVLEMVDVGKEVQSFLEKMETSFEELVKQISIQQQLPPEDLLAKWHSEYRNSFVPDE
jgi:hypothetical protein